VGTERNQEQLMDTSAFMRVPEALDWLKISRSTLYREIAKGELRVTKIGRSTRILRADAETWIEKKRAEVEG
jgi:excisionase family DNA binding protein